MRGPTLRAPEIAGRSAGAPSKHEYGLASKDACGKLKKRIAPERIQAARFKSPFDACRFPKTATHFWATCNLDSMHVVFPKPLRTFGRHALQHGAPSLAAFQVRRRTRAGWRFVESSSCS